jgi:hypothetical protein
MRFYFIIENFGLLSKLEDQRPKRKKIELVPRVGDIWIP